MSHNEIMNWFFVSDTHFGHHNILAFEPDIFPQSNIDERDEFLIDLWNKTVSPNDKVWHLGDIAFNTRLPLLNRLNGNFELLLMGNHEHKNISHYVPYFKDVKATAEIKEINAIVSHYPVHPSQLDERYSVNIHGHLHKVNLPDPRYINISIEQTDLVPISYEELKKRLPK